MKREELNKKAAICLIIYTALNMLSLFINMFSMPKYFWGSYIGGSLIMRLLSYIIIIGLIVGLFTKKPKVITVILGIMTLRSFPTGIFLLHKISFVTVMSIVSSILSFASILILTIQSIILLKDKKQHILAKLWYLPWVLQGIVMLTNIVSTRSFGARFGIINIILSVLYILAIVFINKWFISDSYNEEMDKNKEVNKSGVNSNSIEVDGYCDMLKHILLLLFTFGIWQYIWIYRVTKYLNNTPNVEYRNPTTKLLLCIFVPFYYIYWVYQSAKRIDSLAKEKNVQSDITVISLVLAIFVGIVSPIIMQNKINEIVSGNTNLSKIDTNKNSTTELGVADEIKKYKELLDEGIITIEEFDAKKKQLLNL